MSAPAGQTSPALPAAGQMLATPPAAPAPASFMSSASSAVSEGYKTARLMSWATIIMNVLILGSLIFLFSMLISIRKIVGKIWKKKERYISTHEHYKTPLSPSPSDDDEEGYAVDSDDEETPKPKKKTPAPDEEGYAADDMDSEETPKPKKKTPAPDEEGYAAEADMESEVTPKPKKKTLAPEDEEESQKPKKKTPAPEEFIPTYKNNTIVSEGYYTGENYTQQHPRRLFNIFA